MEYIYVKKKLLNDPEYFLRLGLDLSRSNIHYHAKIGRTGIPVVFLVALGVEE